MLKVMGLFILACVLLYCNIFYISAGAMRALNAKGILHRDMKPQNILLCYPPGQKNPPANQITLKIGKDKAR